MVVSVHACGRSHAEAQLSSCGGKNGAVNSRLTVAEEGLQPSVRSFFTEIPGFPNVGSPVDLRRNQRKSWNAEELRVEQEDVLPPLSTAGVEEVRKEFQG